MVVVLGLLGAVAAVKINRDDPLFNPLIRLFYRTFRDRFALRSPQRTFQAINYLS